MALQVPDILALAGLGIVGDSPPDPLQPPLPDTIHLRWSFGPARAFPWYGYYLLRRIRRKTEALCLRTQFGTLPAGQTITGAGLPLGTNQLTYSEGTFDSNVPITLTNDFDPVALGELDLRNRDFLRFTCVPARHSSVVTYHVGLRGSSESEELRCVRFSREDVGEGGNPRSKDGVVFVIDGGGTRPKSSSVREIEGGMYALDFGVRGEMTLPCEASEVVLLLSNRCGGGSVAGLDDAGEKVAETKFESGDSPLKIELRGKRITRVVVSSSDDEMLLLAVCFRCEGGQPQLGASPIRARAYAGAILLEEREVSGPAGSVVSGSFSHDLITAVEFTGGDAALVDLCLVSVTLDARRGWLPVPKFPSPMMLPVRHVNYPASGNQPTDIAISETEALKRITYGDPNDWSGARFSELHDALLNLVSGGTFGPPMQQISSTLTGVSSSPAVQESPELKDFSPLNFVLAGALQPPVAQMVGLYWADRTAVPGESYDYMIVADHENVGQGNVNTLLQWLAGAQGNFSDIDAWIAYDLTLGSPAPLAAPVDLRAYALPGGTVDLPDGTVRDETNNAGLRWELVRASGDKLAEGAPVMYRVRRADLGALGAAGPAGPADVSDHLPTSLFPHVVAEQPAGASPTRPPDWPPFGTHFLDLGLAEGWFSYRVHGVDIFGRYSPASEPASWHQWVPAPAPVPWYYDASKGDGVVNPFAVALLDKLPPPLPPAVEAFALDHRDPLLVRDAAYDAWRATLTPAEQNNVLGLRVRWLWTYAHMRQAPDTAEFRVYFHPGHLNTLTGRIVGVAPAGADTSSVTTDIPNSEAAGAFINLYLRSGGRSYKIAASAAGSPLILTVGNLGADKSAAPAAGELCALALPPGHGSYEDYGRATAWQDRLWVVPYADAVAEGVIPAPGAGGQPLQGSGATANGLDVTLPAGVDISGVRPFTSHLYLADDTARPSRVYRVHAVDAVARTLTLDAAPSLSGGASAWELGALTRRYELFLPAPGDADRAGLPLTTSLSDPIVYAQIGVTAADGKTHTADDPVRAGTRWGGRFGNESSVGGPATIFRVHRDPPPPPAMPPDSDAVFASRADYNNNSYYTVRWVPQADVDAHVFRALDSSLAARDWLIRSTRSALSDTLGAHSPFFPDGWPGARRGAAAAELNAVNGPASYAGLSADAREVLGRLPGNEGFASRGGLDGRDWLVRRSRVSLGAADLDLFPADWTSGAKRQGAAGHLNAVGGSGDYEGLTDDAWRVLAALPGNEAAFQQVTAFALPNSGPSTANRLGPDNPAGFLIDPSLRAHIDRLDGRSTNRYFYRVAFIDRAQNPGPLGPSSPPVYLPDVLPPRAPVFTRVLAGDSTQTAPGDGKITLRWASNREKDLASYRVYRTAVEADARDVRLMNLLADVATPPGPADTRPAEEVWVDTNAKALVTYLYRLVAVDAAGNHSVPSPPIAARAYDTALPVAPVLTVSWVTQGGTTRAEVSWTSPDEVLLQRREGGGGPWIDLAQWRAPGNVVVRDPFSDSTRGYEYRVLVRKYTGALKRGDPVALPPR